MVVETVVLLDTPRSTKGRAKAELANTATTRDIEKCIMIRIACKRLF